MKILSIWGMQFYPELIDKVTFDNVQTKRNQKKISFGVKQTARKVNAYLQTRFIVVNVVSRIESIRSIPVRLAKRTGGNAKNIYLRTEYYAEISSIQMRN